MPDLCYLFSCSYLKPFRKGTCLPALVAQVPFLNIPGLVPRTGGTSAISKHFYPVPDHSPASAEAPGHAAPLAAHDNEAAAP
jgi:hypothetical protein